MATATATASVKTPEAETEAPTRIQPSKPLSFTNGVLKRHHPLHHHHHLNGPPVVVIYKECLKNHAASLGAHAVDGCGEFMPSPTANSADPTSLKCAACGCHRNFHRREPEEPLPSPAAAIEYQPHHRHHPPPPLLTRGGHSSPNSASPPPISSSYYPSAPHMLLALSAGLSGPPTENNQAMTPTAGTAAAAMATTPNGRKRFRTKFTQDQKERMHEFAERLGWRMQKKDEGLIAEFCSEVRVDRGVFKVWMHNNKNTSGKKETNDAAAAASTPTTNCIDIGSRNSLDSTPIHYPNHHPDDDDKDNRRRRHNDTDNSVSDHAVAANGSSSSS